MDLSSEFVTLIDFERNVFESFQPDERRVQIFQPDKNSNDRILTIDGSPYREADEFGILRLAGNEDRMLTIILFGDPQPQQLMAVVHQFLQENE